MEAKLGIKKETKKLTDEILDKMLGKKSGDEFSRNCYFPTSVRELEELFSDLGIDKSTVAISPMEPPVEIKNESNLCMLVRYSCLGETKQPYLPQKEEHQPQEEKEEQRPQALITLQRQIYVALDFCKTIKDLKYCFAGLRQNVVDSTRFDNQDWFEVAKQSIGLHHKLSRNVVRKINAISKKNTFSEEKVCKKTKE
jgi:hypothetical protein